MPQDYSGVFGEQRRKYDTAYNRAESAARARRSRYFEAPEGSPDYLDVFSRMNPVRPLAEVPWQGIEGTDDLVLRTPPVAGWSSPLRNPVYAAEDAPEGNQVVPHAVTRQGGNDMAARAGTASSAPVVSQPITGAPPASFAEAMFGGDAGADYRTGLKAPAGLKGISEMGDYVPPTADSHLKFKMRGGAGDRSGLGTGGGRSTNLGAPQDWDKYYANTSGYQQEVDEGLRQSWARRREADELAPLEQAGRVAAATQRMEDPGNMKAKRQIIADLQASVLQAESDPIWASNPAGLARKISDMREMAKLELEALDPKADYGRIAMPADPFAMLTGG